MEAPGGGAAGAPRFPPAAIWRRRRRGRATRGSFRPLQPLLCVSRMQRHLACFQAAQPLPAPCSGRASALASSAGGASAAHLSRRPRTAKSRAMPAPDVPAAAVAPASAAPPAAGGDEACEASAALLCQDSQSVALFQRSWQVGAGVQARAAVLLGTWHGARSGDGAAPRRRSQLAGAPAPRAPLPSPLPSHPCSCIPPHADLPEAAGHRLSGAPRAVRRGGRSPARARRRRRPPARPPRPRLRRRAAGGGPAARLRLRRPRGTPAPGRLHGSGCVHSRAGAGTAESRVPGCSCRV